MGGGRTVTVMATKRPPPIRDAHTEARTRVPTAVRTFMTNRDVSRLEVMAATNLSKQTMSERLTGLSPFKDEELLALAWLFDCDPGEFFREHPDLTPSKERNRAKPGSLITAAKAA